MRLFPKLVALTFSILLTSCIAKVELPEPEPSGFQNPSDVCGDVIGEHPCDFSLVDHNGDVVDLYSFYGEVVVLDFSAMWCGPCRVAAQSIPEHALNYEAEGVVFITVLLQNSSGDEPTISDLQAWVNTYAIPPIAPVLGATGSYVDGYSIDSFPRFIFIDRDMTVRHIMRGWSGTQLEQIVEYLLSEQ